MYLLIVLSVVTASYAAICPTNEYMNDTIRQKFLDVHNELRALVASGRAKDGLGGYAPPAAAMDKLRYDCEIEKIAIAHAATCKYEHWTLEAREYTGENLFMQTPAFDSKVEAAEDASRWWFKELEEFGVGTDLIYGDALWGKGVGHYTQMVWQTTTAIGCAVQNCGAKTIVVCNYDPSGNLWNGILYVKGAPCSLCPAYCSNNLCVDEKPSTAPGNTTVVTQKPTAAPTPATVVTQKPTAAPTPATVVTQKPTAAPTPATVVTQTPTKAPEPTTTPQESTEAPTTTTAMAQGPEVPKPTPIPTSNKSKNKKKKNKKKNNKLKSKKKNKKKKY